MVCYRHLALKFAVRAYINTQTHLVQCANIITTVACHAMASPLVLPR